LQDCRKSLEKSSVILALDFSGSCFGYSSFFKKLAQIAEKFKDVVVLDASNGFDGQNWCYTERKYYSWESLRGRTIIFFGDFDGGASLVELSKIAKVYWLSCEERYIDLSEHDWCEGYSLDDFRGKYYPCTNEIDFCKIIKKIR
jgi:hypothetical protein